MTTSDHHTTPCQPRQAPPYPPARTRQSPVSQPIPQQFPSRHPQRYPSPVQPVRPPKRRARIFLLIACVVAFATAAVFAGLYVGADGDHDTAIARLDEREAQLADVRAQVTAAEDAQEAAEARTSDLEAEKTALTACVDAVRHYLWDGLEGTARAAALDVMFTACQ